MRESRADMPSKHASSSSKPNSRRARARAVARRREEVSNPAPGPNRPNNRHIPSKSNISEEDNTLPAFILSRFHQSTMEGRIHTPLVAAANVRENQADGNPVELQWHPSARYDTQTPLRFATSATNTVPILLDNLYITGQMSADAEATRAAFTCYASIPSGPGSAARSPLDDSLGRFQRLMGMSLDTLHNQGHPCSSEDLVHATFHPLYAPSNGYEPQFYDDSNHPVANGVPLDSQLRAFPIAYEVTLPKDRSYGFMLLASRQTAPIKDLHKPCELGGHKLNEADATLLQTHRMTVVRTISKQASQGEGTLTCDKFAGKSPESCLRFYRECLMYTHAEIVDQHLVTCNKATNMGALPLRLQSLWQFANATEPTARWSSRSDKPTSVTIQVAEDPYSPILRQAQTTLIELDHPSDPRPITFSFQPPTLNNNGGTKDTWRAFFHTALLVQSSHELPPP